MPLAYQNSYDPQNQYMAPSSYQPPGMRFLQYTRGFGRLLQLMQLKVPCIPHRATTVDQHCNTLPMLHLNRRLPTLNPQLGIQYRMVMIRTNQIQLPHSRAFIPRRPSPRMTPTNPRSPQIPQPSQHTTNTITQLSNLPLFIRFTTLTSPPFGPARPPRVGLHLRMV